MAVTENIQIDYPDWTDYAEQLGADPVQIQKGHRALVEETFTEPDP